MIPVKKFEYWRELVVILIMLTVLVLDLTLFDGLHPLGEDNDQSVVVTGVR